MEAYIGEIRIFSGAYAPEGWNICDGSLLKISEYNVLFALLGTLYGGDGRTTFALPDLRGRLAVGSGQGTGLSNYAVGQQAGSVSVALTTNQIPDHTHALYAANVPATLSNPVNAMFAAATDSNTFYVDGSKEVTGTTNYSPNAIGTAGASQPHANIMQGVAVNFIICTQQGMYPDFS